MRALRRALIRLRFMWRPFCPHPGRFVRADGFWNFMEPPKASATCLLCHQTTVLQLRQDLADRVRHTREFPHATMNVIAPAATSIPEIRNAAR